MHVTAVTLRGFRGLDTRVSLSGPLSIIAGENNVGKSSVIDALRIITAPYHDYRNRLFVTSTDFSHDGFGNRQCDELAISIDLSGLSETERGRMATCLTPSVGPDAARLTVTARLNEADRVVSEYSGGDLGNRDIEPFARSAIKHVYLPPLRDAARDLRPGQGNRLAALISAFAPTDGVDRTALEQIINEANDSLAAVPAIDGARQAIVDSLAGLTGSGPFSQKSDLQFSPARYDRIVSALRALMGRHAPLDLDENGLGYNNLLYMAVLLSVLRKADEAPLQLLLVEEPEAHLHPQLQDLLMRYLEDQAGAGAQVILTTHSPQFASSAKVERMTVIAENSVSLRAAYHLGGLAVPPDDLAFLRRFLDVTKSSLLFAKGVLLVEGIAEQLVIPQIASQLELPLSRHGVAVINVGGLNFGPFSALFEENGLPFRCAIISDGDPVVEADYDPDDLNPSAMAKKLQQSPQDRVEAFLAKRTFEWDLAFAGSGANRDVLLEALSKVRPRKAKELKESKSQSQAWADEFLAAVEKHKGVFAQSLANHLASNGIALPVVPEYISAAVRWAVPTMPTSEDV